MKISELIEKLKIMESIYGDIPVVVRHRDNQGDWPGYDKLRFDFEKVSEEDARYKNVKLSEGDEVIVL